MPSKKIKCEMCNKYFIHFVTVRFQGKTKRKRFCPACLTQKQVVLNRAKYQKKGT